MAATIPPYVIDIGNYLKSHGYSNLFYNNVPTNVTPFIALFAQDGLPSVPTLGFKMVLFKPQLKILVRNMSGEAAGNTANSINELLNFMTNTQLGSTWIKRIEVIGSGPFPVSKTLQEGSTFSINYNLQIN